MVGVQSTTPPVSSPTPSLSITPIPTSFSSLPTSTPTPTSPMPVQSTIINGTFRQDLTGWQTQGTVKVIPINPAESPDQSEATFLVRLADHEQLGWLGTHQLTQTVALNSTMSTLQFWYRVWTEETTLGFDDPALAVILDGQVVWRIGSMSAWPTDSTAPDQLLTLNQPMSSGWQLVSIPLARFTKVSKPHTLQFITGQTGDQSLATWVDMTNIALVPSTPTPALVTYDWWPSSFSLEWPVFKLNLDTVTTSLIGSLADVAHPLEWPELLNKLKVPVGWQGHTLTTLASAQANSWQPLSWSSQTTTPQPDFAFPFSLSHEGFTGPVAASLADAGSTSGPLASPPGGGWLGWNMVWDLLSRPQSVIWLSSSVE